VTRASGGKKLCFWLGDADDYSLLVAMWLIKHRHEFFMRHGGVLRAEKDAATRRGSRAQLRSGRRETR
jgi:hypothetical protein